MGVNNTSTRVIQQIYLDSMALWPRKCLIKRFKRRFIQSTGKSRERLIKFFNTIGHRSINGLCFYERNQTNIFFLVSIICTNWKFISICSVISQNLRAPVASTQRNMIHFMSTEMEGSAGSFSGTAANVVALAEEGWVLKFVLRRSFIDLKLQVSLSELSYNSIEWSQSSSSLLLWVGVASNGTFFTTISDRTAFSAQPTGVFFGRELFANSATWRQTDDGIILTGAGSIAFVYSWSWLIGTLVMKAKAAQQASQSTKSFSNETFGRDLSFLYPFPFIWPDIIQCDDTTGYFAYKTT